MIIHPKQFYTLELQSIIIMKDFIKTVDSIKTYIPCNYNYVSNTLKTLEENASRFLSLALFSNFKISVTYSTAVLLLLQMKSLKRIHFLSGGSDAWCKATLRLRHCLQGWTFFFLGVRLRSVCHSLPDTICAIYSDVVLSFSKCLLCLYPSP